MVPGNYDKALLIDMGWVISYSPSASSSCSTCSDGSTVQRKQWRIATVWSEVDVSTTLFARGCSWDWNRFGEFFTEGRGRRELVTFGARLANLQNTENEAASKAERFFAPLPLGPWWGLRPRPMHLFILSYYMELKCMPIHLIHIWID